MERVERMLLSLHRGMTISVHYQRLLLSWNGRARLLAGAGLGPTRKGLKDKMARYGIQAGES